MRRSCYHKNELNKDSRHNHYPIVTLGIALIVPKVLFFSGLCLAILLPFSTQSYGQTMNITPNTWVRVGAPAVRPNVGYDLRFSYDSDIKEMVMFGGDYVCGTGYCRSTWTYSVPNNIWTMRNDDNPPTNFPAGRCQPGLAYNSDLNQTLMFSGCVSRPLGGYSWGNVWNYSVSTGQWVDYGGSGPNGLLQTCNAARRLVYDTNRQVGVLIAPNVNNQVDIWEFAPSGGWTRKNVSGTPYPQVDMYIPVVFDSKRGNYIFVAEFNTDGSGNPNPFYPGTNQYQTWIYNPNSGTITRSASAQHPNPGGSPHGHEIVYDSFNDVVLFYGGNCNSQLWAYDIQNDSWSQLNPAGDIPPGHDYFAMAYDSTENVMVVWGTGTNCNGGNHEDPPPTYLYRYANGTPPAPDTTAPIAPLGLNIQ